MNMKSTGSYQKKAISTQKTGYSGSPYSPPSSGHTGGMRGRPTLFGDRMVTVSFRIPASYAERIEKHSEKAKESKSDFFRRAIDLALRDEVVAEEQEKPEEHGTNEDAQ